MAGNRRSRELGQAALVLLLLLWLAALCTTVGNALASDPAPDLRLIVNPANAAATFERQFIADAFLKKATRWPDGEAIEPVDQRFGAPVRERFSQHVLRRSAAAVRSYWQQRIFTGRGVPPPELDSDEAVLRYVSTHRGAVGYVSESAAIAGARVVTLR